jgi:hypothetical protein
MEKDLKTLIQETLLKHGKIIFDVTYVTKGFIVEIEIGEKRNEECGQIYDELSEWLGYGEFIDFLISRNVQHNFNGEIFLENEEICFNLTLKGYIYEYDDSDRRYIEFRKEFITNDLNIGLSEIGMDVYNEENLSVQFYKMKGSPVERLELTYFKKQWHQIKLDNDQYEVLNKFIELEIEKAIPIYYIDFECEIEWEVECEENSLEFYYWSTPIKLKLDEILSQ